MHAGVTWVAEQLVVRFVKNSNFYVVTPRPCREVRVELPPLVRRCGRVGDSDLQHVRCDLECDAADAA